MSEVFEPLFLLEVEFGFQIHISDGALLRYGFLNSSHKGGNHRFDLVIRSVSELDVGLYACTDRDNTRENDFGEATLIAVSNSSSSCVVSAPSPAVLSGSFVEGDTLTMRCSVEYFTSSTLTNLFRITWFKENVTSLETLVGNASIAEAVSSGGGWSRISSTFSRTIRATDDTCCYRCSMVSATGEDWSVGLSCE